MSTFFASIHGTCVQMLPRNVVDVEGVPVGTRGKGPRHGPPLCYMKVLVDV